MRIRFRAEAVDDAARAVAWYDAKEEGLGDSFLDALEQAVQLISEYPSAFPAVSAGPRRVLLKRFPYALYYQLGDPSIEVLACLHMRQSQGRLGGETE